MITYGISGAPQSALAISGGVVDRADINGSLLVTEADDTLVSSAVLQITAVSAQSGGVPYFGVSGTPIAAGAVSGSQAPDIAFGLEGADTVSAAGASSIRGSSTTVEDGDAVSASASLLLVAIGALAEAGDVVSASSLVAIAGTASITEDGDSVSGVFTYGTYGRLTSSGTGVGGISAASVSSSPIGSAGTLELLFAVEDPDTLAATASVATRGQATLLEANDIVESTGGRRRTLRASGSSSSHRIGAGSSSGPRINIKSAA